MPATTSRPTPSADDVRVLLEAAVAAPSIHNTQPWRFEVDGADVWLRADSGRQLAHVDPEGRSMLVSCGAALLNLQVAAEHFGYEPTTRLLPVPGDPLVVARVTLSGRDARSGMAGALYDAIALRHTHRGPFEDRPLPQSVQSALIDAAAAEGADLRLVTDPHELGRIVQLIHAGDLERDLNPELAEEAAEWTGVPPDRMDGVPGYALGPLPDDPHAPFRDLRRGRPIEGRQQESFERTPTLGVLATRDDDRPAWIRAGAALERVLLVATVEGVSASFANQPLERADLRWLVRDPRAGIGYPQMLLRLGYGAAAPPIPRRPVEEVLDGADVLAEE